MTVPTMLAVFCLASVAAVTDTGSTISAGNVDETTRLMADSDIKSAFLAALRSKPCGDGMVDAYMRAVKLCGEDRRRRARIVVQIAREHMRTGKRYALCSAISRMANRAQEDESRKALAVSTLKQYSRTIPVTSLWADEFLLSLDPSYETSDDRKALLREVAARRVNDYQIDYATNALKRIDAKIQAERKGD